MSALAIDNELTDASLVQSERPREVPVYAATKMPGIMVRWWSLAGPSRKFALKKMFVIQLENSERGVLARHRSLPCSGHGKTAGEAIEDFCEMFEVQWEALVECPPDQLTVGAQQARECFLSFAQPVESD